MQKFFNILGFVFKSAVVGLACAAVAILITSRSGSVVEIGGQSANGTAESLRASFAAAVERTAPAVVSVYVDRTAITPTLQLERDPVRQSLTGRARLAETRVTRRGLGSGVIVSNDGYIVTNNHVTQDADNIRVALWDGRITIASLVGSDPETDLAVLKVEINDLPTISSLSEQPLRVGDVVLAIGNPLGLGKTVTMGIVSATGRMDPRTSIYQSLIQTDAAINRGNSGGALVSSDGQLVGINTAMLGNESAEGIGFAIPIDTVKDVLESIITHGQVSRGWLGIEMDDGRMHPSAYAKAGNQPGVIINQVYPNTPGDWAGLQPGDYVTRFDHRIIPDIGTMYEMIADSPPAEDVDIEYWREGQQFETTARLIPRPQNMGTSG